MINWKIRFTNPLFIAQIIMAIFVPILTYYGLTGSDITTWGKLLKLITDAISNPYVVVMIIVSVYNALTDPTTPGQKDSELVMNKKKLQ